MNYVNYFCHRKLYIPVYYDRNYENDLSGVNYEYVQRAAQIALPFISLYKPAGSLISLSMGSLRTISAGKEVLEYRDMNDLALKVGHVAWAALPLAGTWCNFSLSLYLTTCADLMTGCKHVVEHLKAGRQKEAGEELAQGVSSLLYLGVISTGSLELTMVSLLVRALMSFYQAREEWGEGRMPEAAAKTMMGLIRLYQGKQQFHWIQRRNDLLRVRKYQELMKRIKRGRDVRYLLNHPLIGLANNPSVLNGVYNQEFDCGTVYHGYGKGLVKGMNVTMRHLEDQTELEFKVNHVFRERIEAVVSGIRSIPTRDLNDLMAISNAHASHVSIAIETEELDDHWVDLIDENYVIKLEGLGEILIGASSECPNPYDWVKLRMNKGKTLFDFHEALSIFDMDDALRQSASEDIARMKMGHLFRMFYPSEATVFERTDPFFDLPMDEFKEALIHRAPDMESILEKYMPRMELRETLPGRMRYAVDGLADELRNRGAVGLTAVLTGTWSTRALNERVASVINMGMLSSESRERIGVTGKGLSPLFDRYMGGDDSVFTQLVTDQTQSYFEFGYHGSVRFLISLEALELGSYQFHDGAGGTRRLVSSGWWSWWSPPYLHRDNIFDFTEEERWDSNDDHEVMLKERIAPEYIRGMVVDSEQTKRDLWKYLNLVGIVNEDRIFSKTRDQFIHVGSKVNASHF